MEILYCFAVIIPLCFVKLQENFQITLYMSVSFITKNIRPPKQVMAATQNAHTHTVLTTSLTLLCTCQSTSDIQTEEPPQIQRSHKTYTNNDTDWIN